MHGSTARTNDFDPIKTNWASSPIATKGDCLAGHSDACLHGVKHHYTLPSFYVTASFSGRLPELHVSIHTLSLIYVKSLYVTLCVKITSLSACGLLHSISQPHFLLGCIKGPGLASNQLLVLCVKPFTPCGHSQWWFAPRVGFCTNPTKCLHF